MSVPQTIANSQRIAGQPMCRARAQQTTPTTHRRAGVKHARARPDAPLRIGDAAGRDRADARASSSAEYAAMRVKRPGRRGQQREHADADARPVARRRRPAAATPRATPTPAMHQNTRNGKPPTQADASASAIMTTPAATRSGRSAPNRERPTGPARPSIAARFAMRSRRPTSHARSRPPAPRPAVAPLAAAIFVERGLERGLVEIRPMDRQKHEFGIGGLPEQEIRQPLLA